jgi:hypothetical protein
MSLITQLSINALVESEWRYAFTTYLRNYIFVQGSYFAETDIRLAGVA